MMGVLGSSGAGGGLVAKLSILQPHGPEDPGRLQSKESQEVMPR